VAEGAFEQVVRDALRRGVNKVLHAAPAADLAALADAARYEGEDALAVRALLSLRTRFAASSDAKAAPYFLARVSRGERALHWYETYLREQPDGAFVAPALGALMNLHDKRGEQGAAAECARAYLRRAPAGPHAAMARTILAREARSRQGEPVR
jgi:hypothetical protein